MDSSGLGTAVEPKDPLTRFEFVVQAPSGQGRRAAKAAGLTNLWRMHSARTGSLRPRHVSGGATPDGQALAGSLSDVLEAGGIPVSRSAIVSTPGRQGRSCRAVPQGPRPPHRDFDPTPRTSPPPLPRWPASGSRHRRGSSDLRAHRRAAGEVWAEAVWNGGASCSSGDSAPRLPLTAHQMSPPVPVEPFRPRHDVVFHRFSARGRLRDGSDLRATLRDNPYKCLRHDVTSTDAVSTTVQVNPKRRERIGGTFQHPPHTRAPPGSWHLPPSPPDRTYEARGGRSLLSSGIPARQRSWPAALRADLRTGTLSGLSELA
jgi:hypothetical protein